VVVMISVASVIVFIDAPTFVPEWAGGWAVVGIVFTANELKFWIKFEPMPCTAFLPPHRCRDRTFQGEAKSLARDT